MNELIREIEEDIRNERLQKLWNAFGKLLVTISVCIVLGTAAYVVLQNHRTSVAMEQTSKLLRGIDRMRLEDFKTADSELAKLTDDTSSPYYGIAMLRRAQSQAAVGDKEGAKRSYQALASHSDEFGALAQLMLTADNVAIAPPYDRNAPLYHSLREAQAWQLMDEGKKDEAIEIFAALNNDEAAPATMRARMQQVLGHIAPQKLVKKSAAPAEEAPVEKKVKVTPNE